MRRIKATYLLLRLTIGIMFLCLIAACLYLKVGTIQSQQGNASWMNKDETFNITTSSFLIQFEWAFYWSVTTILTVGYGDITPQAPIEVLVTIVCMMISCIIFAYCVNSIWEILQDLKSKETKYLEITNAISRYMRDKKIHQDLQRRICVQIEYQYKKERSRDEELEKGIISKLSPNLREELIYESYAIFFEKVNWINQFSKEFIKSLAFSIEEYTYPENDPIYQMSLDKGDENGTQGLYFLKKGKVECYIPFSGRNQEKGVYERQVVSQNGVGIDSLSLKKLRDDQIKEDKQIKKKNIHLKELCSGQHFGENSIFTSEPIPFSVKSVEFTTIYKIPRNKFLETIRKFPNDYEIFCEIKEKLEFKQKLSQKYRTPKFKCEYCSKSSSLTYEHDITECPNIVLHSKLKNFNSKYLEECKTIQVSNKNYKRRFRQKERWRQQFKYMQSCCKSAFQHFGHFMDHFQKDTIISLSNISVVSNEAYSIREEGEEEKERVDQTQEAISIFNEHNMEEEFENIESQGCNLSDRAEEDSLNHLEDDRNNLDWSMLEQEKNLGTQHQQQIYLGNKNQDPKKKKEKLNYYNEEIEEVEDDQKLSGKQFNKQAWKLNIRKKEALNENKQFLQSLNDEILQKKRVLLSDPDFAIQNLKRGSLIDDNPAKQSMNLFMNQSHVGGHKQQKSLIPQTQQLQSKLQNQHSSENIMSNSNVRTNPPKLSLTKLNKNMHDQLYQVKQVIKEEIGRFKVMFTTMQLLNKKKNKQSDNSSSDDDSTSLRKNKKKKKVSNQKQNNEGDLKSQAQIEYSAGEKEEGEQLEGEQQKQITLDIDRMQIFTEYRKEENYDKIIKSERERQKRSYLQNQQGRNNRVSTRLGSQFVRPSRLQSGVGGDSIHRHRATSERNNHRQFNSQLPVQFIEI